MITSQNPLVRRWHTCPKCLNSKDEGLVLCWPCHRTEKRQNDGGYSKTTEQLIANAEAALALETCLPKGWTVHEGGVDHG